MGLYRSDTLFSGLIHYGAYFRGGGGGGLIHECKNSARIYITLPNIFEKESHTDIYPTNLCRPPYLTPIYLAAQSRVGSSIQY